MPTTLERIADDLVPESWASPVSQPGGVRGEGHLMLA